MAYGYRAAWKTLETYWKHFHSTKQPYNVTTIIGRWAPPTENATRNYIDTVSRETGIPATRKLSFDNKKVMCDIVAAMIKVECGMSIDRDIIESGYDLL